MSDSVDSDSFLSTVLKGGSVVFLGLVFQLGLSFVAKLLIARHLGQVDYGAVSLGIITASFVTTIIANGLSAGIGRHLPQYDDPEERRGILVSAFQIGIPPVVVAGTVIVVFAPWIARNVFHDPAIVPILHVFGAAVPILAFVRLSIGAVRGLQRSVPKAYIDNVTMPLVRFLGIAVVVVFGFGALGAAWAYFASYLAAALLGMYYLVTETSLFSRGIAYAAKHREIFAFSAPLFISSAMTFVFAQFDILLLGFFTSTGDVGVYNVIYPIAQLLRIGITSFAFIFMPVLSELHSEGASADMRRLYQTVTKWIFTATLPLFLILALFPTMSIRVTFGTDYVGGAAALSVLAVAFFTHTMAGPNANTLTSIGRTRLIMYDTVLAALLNLGLNLLLIPRYSFFGAAMATAVSYLLLNLTYSYQLYREIGIQPFTRGLVVPGVIGILIVASIYLFTTTFLTITVPLLVGMFGLFVCLYGLAVLRFGIDREEIMLVMRFEDRYDVDFGPIKTIARRLIGLDDRN